MQVRLYHHRGARCRALVGGLFFRHRLVVEPFASLGSLHPTYATWLLITHRCLAFQQFTLFSLVLFSCIVTFMKRTPITKTKQCACGCGESFEARMTYRVRDESGRPTFPNYKRGHHPNCAAHHTGTKPAWNAGLRKGDHPSLDRMGFQKGHPAFKDWSHVHEKQRSDPAYRERWLQSKKGQVPWNAGKTKSEYPNGIASGSEHGNWLGGHRGLRDSAEYKRFRLSILKRDNYTCTSCGDKNYKGRGSRALLEVDHIEPVCFAPHRVMDPTNARTLCASCHRATETFGPKVRHYIKKRLEKEPRRLP